MSLAKKRLQAFVGKLLIFATGWAVCGCAILPPDVFPPPWDGNIPTLSEPSVLSPEAIPPCIEMSPIDVSAVVDYFGCAPYVILTKDTLWRTVESVAKVPLRDIVSGQFKLALARIFLPPRSSECPDVMLKVIPTRVIIKMNGAKMVESKVDFSVRVINQKEQKTLREWQYHGEDKAMWDGTCVPLSVYKSVNQIVGALRSDIDRYRYIFDPVTLPPDNGPEPRDPNKGPTFLAYKMSSQPDENGVCVGSCRLACNDWEPSRAADWLRLRLYERARDPLGVPVERIRVIYEENTLDAEKHEWQVTFKAFARVPWFLEYDRFSRTGVCAVDLELAKLTAQQGAEKMKEYVMQEMNRRGIVFEDGKAVDGAGVRFDEFKTDKRYNIISCAFKLIK